jgi:hypothetical protein
MRRILLVVDTFLALLFGVCVIGLLIVSIEGSNQLDILIFFVVIGVPDGLLRFIILGNPLPFSALPAKKT